MKEVIKNLFSLVRKEQPAKLATDMRGVEKVSMIDTIIHANDSYMSAIFGTVFKKN